LWYIWREGAKIRGERTERIPGLGKTNERKMYARIRKGWMEYFGLYFCFNQPLPSLPFYTCCPLARLSSSFASLPLLEEPGVIKIPTPPFRDDAIFDEVQLHMVQASSTTHTCAYQTKSHLSNLTM